MSDEKITISDLELMQHFDGEHDDPAAVRAWLEADADARDKLASLAIAAAVVREQIDRDPRADGVADAVMAAIEAEDAPASREREKVALPGTAAPANDNSRVIYIVATAAAAIAAGLFLWGRTAPDHELAEQQSAASSRSGPTSLVDEAAPPPAARADRAVDAASEDDALGVEIAAVDFGSHSGSVFYVSGARSGATAVVWVTDVGEQ